MTSFAEKIGYTLLRNNIRKLIHSRFVDKELLKQAGNALVTAAGKQGVGSKGRFFAVSGGRGLV
ncbi:MAG TPA: hypothetical protein DDY31_19160 [Lachnospiraceae bacterium]|nr:hypothetical protein [Lachnospiraceae bacterium]